MKEENLELLSQTQQRQRVEANASRFSIAKAMWADRPWNDDGNQEDNNENQDNDDENNEEQRDEENQEVYDDSEVVMEAYTSF